MKRFINLGIVAATIALSAPALADVAPEPCEGKKAGDACVTFADKPGTCVEVDCGGSDCGNGLDCSENGTAGATTGTGGNTSASATTGSGTGDDDDDDDGSNGSKDEAGCAMAPGTARGMSAFAVVAAVGMGAWLARRRRN